MCRFTVELPQQISSFDTHDEIRIVMFWDTQTNGIAATLDTLLESNSNTIANIYAFKDLFKGTRFKIVCDKTIAMNSAAGAFDSTNPVFGRVTRKVNLYYNMAVPVYYDNTTGDISELSSNNIQIRCITKHGAIVIDGAIRIRYSDH